jgi:hypothetical protein
MHEAAIRSALVQGTLGATLLATLFLILTRGPEALKTVMWVLTRRRLIRLAVEGEDEHVRRRARDLLRLLETQPPGKPSRKPPPDTIERPDG